MLFLVIGFVEIILYFLEICLFGFINLWLKLLLFVINKSFFVFLLRWLIGKIFRCWYLGIKLIMVFEWWFLVVDI